MQNYKIIAICHNIRSAHNIGSIFRTADAAGVDKIILGGYCPPADHSKIHKTALGAEKLVPSEKIWQTWRAIDILKKEGYFILALEIPDQISIKKKAQNIFTFKPNFPLALVLGNEVRGLSDEILKRCDKIVYIPMRGEKESLNVSVAFGVAIYSLLNYKSFTNI